MNNQSPFYIYISNSPVTATSGSSNGSSGGEWSNAQKQIQSSSSGHFSQSQSGNKKFASKYITTRLLESGVHIIERVSNEYVSYIGYGKGDYEQSKKIQFTLSYGERLANIGVSAGAALATGHPVVAGIDVVVGLVGFAVTTVWDAKESTVATTASNYNAEQIERRAGLSSTRDGSRGTEN